MEKRRTAHDAAEVAAGSLPVPAARGWGLFGDLGALCRCDERLARGWLGSAAAAPGIRRCVVTVVVCAGLYGYALGCWRAPQMGAFVALKLPLLIFCVLAVNCLANGILSHLLGSGLSLRQTLLASLASFTGTALILGAVSPIALLAVACAPSPDTARAARWHEFYLLGHTVVIAYAGVVGNHRAYRLLVAATGAVAVARRTFCAWLAINLFVGAQLSYNLRPFFGNPAKPVEVLRPDAFNGSFYEVVARAIISLTATAP